VGTRSEVAQAACSPRQPATAGSRLDLLSPPDLLSSFATLFARAGPHWTIPEPHDFRDFTRCRPLVLTLITTQSANRTSRPSVLRSCSGCCSLPW
jgi:hypothetical protein